MGSRRINQNKYRTCFNGEMWGKILQCSICVKAPTEDCRETASFVRASETWKPGRPSYSKTKKKTPNNSFIDINSTQLYMLQNTRIINTFAGLWSRLIFIKYCTTF